MTTNPPLPAISPFGRLKKRLWLGTLALDLNLAAGFALFKPEYLQSCFYGILLGLLYLWSLTFNAENPKKGIQFAFSTIRSMAFAYLLVKVSHAQAMEFAIVMCGFLSYKVILTVEYVVRALSIFRGAPPVKAGQ